MTSRLYKFFGYKKGVNKKWNLRKFSSSIALSAYLVTDYLCMIFDRITYPQIMKNPTSTHLKINKSSKNRKSKYSRLFSNWPDSFPNLNRQTSFSNNPLAENWHILPPDNACKQPGIKLSEFPILKLCYKSSRTRCPFIMDSGSQC